MKKIFICKKHEDYGNLGWLMKGSPDNFEPFTGMGTAHDCLEHFSGDNGEINQEIEALACALWIRGQGNYWSIKGNRNSPEQNIASDFTFTLWRLYENEEVYKKAPRTKRLDISYENSIQEVIKLVKRNFRSEFEEEFEEISKTEKFHFFVNNIEGWLRIGFRKAIKKYPKVHDACYLFMQIEKIADNTLKHAEEGDELEIVYDLKRFIVKTRIIGYYETEDNY